MAKAFHDRGTKAIVTRRCQGLLDAVAVARPGMAAVTLELDDLASVAALVAPVCADHPDLNVLKAG